MATVSARVPQIVPKSPILSPAPPSCIVAAKLGDVVTAAVMCNYTRPEPPVKPGFIALPSLSKVYTEVLSAI